MNTLLNKLEKNHSDDLNYAMTPVTLKEYNLMDGYTLNKPCYAVLDLNNKKQIALHGKDYNLIPYEKIIKGLSDALVNYGINLDNTRIDFNIDTDLNYMKLRIIFNDIVYGLNYNKKDTLNLAIEVISSYDASIIFKLRTMFFRLICSNGMAEIKPIASSFKKHTTGLNYMDQFKQLENFSNQVELLSDQYETLTRVPLTSTEVGILFKSFTNSDNKLYLLNEVLNHDLSKLNKSLSDATLFDVFNAVTNYSTHNQRAISKNGTREIPNYEITQSNMDAVKSTSQREIEVHNFLKGKVFLTFYDKGINQITH
tara:strand:+ start:47 stop:982 length:936 start_codon:yes stop_codon:yes gene_type:complete